MPKSSSHRHVFIIAEAGVNHNGEMANARRLVDVALESGADAVKFQLFSSDELVKRDAPKADYQKQVGRVEESQMEMLRMLELTVEQQAELSRYCAQLGIVFMTSAFSIPMLRHLPDLGVRHVKVPSGEITNLPYLQAVACLPCEEIILSTGASDISEVDAAVSAIIAAGAQRERITLLHCNTEYPSPLHDVNLRAMVTLQEKFGVRVGYSDHTTSLLVPVAAVALGATCIEKHFTLDKSLSGPDHRASLEPGELREMVRNIRATELILGDGRKYASSSEIKNRDVVRKSIVAKRLIRKGEIFTNENLTAKRPGSGMSPMSWELLLGKPASKEYQLDEFIMENVKL